MARRKKVKVPIRLTPAQKKIHSSEARHRIVSAGRRFGKTHYAAFWLMKWALEHPGRAWCIAKTSGLGTDEFMSRWLNWLPEELITGQDRRMGRIRLKVGSMHSELGVVSADKPDNLRGRGLSAAVIDEAAFVTPTLYDMIIAPMLLDRSAPSLVISSPKFGWFTQTHEKAKRGELPNWEAFHFTVYDNAKSRGGIIEDEEIETIRKRTPEHIWLQEYMAEAVEGSGLVYHMLRDANVVNLEERFPNYHSFPVVVGIDWGRSDDTGVGWLTISPEGYVVLTDEHSKRGIDPGSHAGIIKRVSREYTKLTERDFVLSHDAFGKRGGGDETIADQFAMHDIRCKRSTKEVNATINKMRSFLAGDGGVPWLYISERCQKTIQAMQSYEWNDHEPDVLQGIRYALEEVCRRRLTPFWNRVASTNIDGALNLKNGVYRDPGGVYLEKPKSPKQGQWHWDEPYGALH